MHCPIATPPRQNSFDKKPPRAFARGGQVQGGTHPKACRQERERGNAHRDILHVCEGVSGFKHHLQRIEA